MKRITLLLFGSAILGVVALSQGKEFWQKKDYKQWSDAEVRKMLEDSPWARNYTLSQTFITPLQNSGGETQDRERVENPRFTYRVQFRSAQPLRQALVRQMQLAQKYEQMAPDKKQQFDAQAEKFLSASFPDSVIVHVSFTTNVQQDDREAAAHWQRQTTEQLRNTAYLIGPKGEQIELQRYIVADSGRSFQFVFPRRALSPQDKSIKLEFRHPRLRTQGEARVLIEFRVEKMLVQGEPVY
jgi:hypothetical protein